MTQELNQVQALGHMGGCSAENQSLLRSTAQKEQQKSCPTKPNYYINKVPVQREHTESPLGGQGLRFRSSANSRHHASARTRWVLIGEDCSGNKCPQACGWGATERSLAEPKSVSFNCNKLARKKDLRQQEALRRAPRRSWSPS